jgi:hypothetical protein
MKYLFEHLNGGLEITDPIIEIIGLSVGNPKTFNHDYINNRYGVNILLITQSVTYGLGLENIQAEEMVLAENGPKMPAQVLKALNEQFGVL